MAQDRKTGKGCAEDSTRHNLLEAAAEVFAAKGFHGATTRDIAALAHANIASLHYHFQDKRRLYRAVFEYLVERMWVDHPLPKSLDEPGPPDGRLADFIESAVRRLLQGGRPAWQWTLLVREMTDPSDALDIIVERVSRTLFGALGRIVRELLGPGASDESVRLCSASIVGQFAFYRFARPLVDRLIPHQKFDDAAIARLSAHITRFSLEAIRAMRSPAKPRRH